MRTIGKLTLFAGVLAMLFVFAGGRLHAIGEGWIMDFDAAKTQAAAENKHILMDFTGSDWCGWCIRLDQEVFSQDVFKTQIPEQFVLLALDFPRDTSHLTEEIQAQNSRLQQEHAVRGYPTIILTDAQGVAYARTGYNGLEADEYVDHLKELRSNHLEAQALIKKAQEDEELSDEDKARTLDQALDKVQSWEIIQQRYAATLDQILTLDKDDELKLKSKYEKKKTVEEIRVLVESRKYDEALPKIEAALGAYGATGQTAQELLFMKGVGLLNAGQMDEGRVAVTQALEAAPEGDRVAKIKNILERLDAQDAEPPES